MPYWAPSKLSTWLLVQNKFLKNYFKSRQDVYFSHMGAVHIQITNRSAFMLSLFGKFELKDLGVKFWGPECVNLCLQWKPACNVRRSLLPRTYLCIAEKVLSGLHATHADLLTLKSNLYLEKLPLSVEARGEHSNIGLGGASGAMELSLAFPGYF